MKSITYENKQVNQIHKEIRKIRLTKIYTSWYNYSMPLVNRKKEKEKRVAKVKNMIYHDGLTVKETANLCNLSIKTVSDYIKEIKAQHNLIPDIDKSHLDNLKMLNLQARKAINDRLADFRPIDLVALMDRSFQQIRELEGKSNIAQTNVLVQIIHDSHQEDKKLKQLVPVEEPQNV